MELSNELINLAVRFSFNLFVAYIIIKLIYHRDHNNNDFVFTYFMFNSLIFFFAYILGNMNINIGFAFGLFAVFAILRYRTDPIPIKEMTYLFTVITIGVINALSRNEVSYSELLFANLSIILLSLFLEKYWQNNFLYRRSIEYEIMENIRPENHEKLIEDLKYRTGLDIKYFEIRRIFLDRARIRIYSKNEKIIKPS